MTDIIGPELDASASEPSAGGHLEVAPAPGGDTVAVRPVGFRRAG